VTPWRVPDVDHEIPFVCRAFSILFASSALCAAFVSKFDVGGWRFGNPEFSGILLRLGLQPGKRGPVSLENACYESQERVRGVRD
jgi:hypothetical protein